MTVHIQSKDLHKHFFWEVNRKAHHESWRVNSKDLKSKNVCDGNGVKIPNKVIINCMSKGLILCSVPLGC